MNKVIVGNCEIELVLGDITNQNVDAIVNAANEGLRGGSGVDGAIHKVAGPSVMQETERRYPEGCPTGQAVETSAGNLQADYIFHTVGPMWQGGTAGEPELLASCYQSCLDLANEKGCKSIAFPAVSAGVYGYPVDQVAKIALGTSYNYLVEHQAPAHIRFVLFSDGVYSAFSHCLETMIS